MDAEQEQFLEDGTFVLKWSSTGWPDGHPSQRVSGEHGRHYGHAMGTADGSRTTGSSSSHSATPRFGFGHVGGRRGILNWRNEMRIGGGEWFVIEEYPMVPVQVPERSRQSRGDGSENAIDGGRR